MNIKLDEMLDKCKLLLLWKYNGQKENGGRLDDVTHTFVV